ncbi:ATP-dependent protease La domain-containing protein [Nemania sp. NC0429]|nr:ATP-dependent protease La domain-containing protein [Nemania sp. NC0429]
MSSIQENTSQPSPSPTPPDEGPISRPSETGSIVIPDPTGTRQPEASASADLPLGAVTDARQIIRLIQCQICNGILRNPTTLPCGYSICKACLPDTRPRADISWPAVASRLQGFTCPFADCGKEHAAADCAVDVTLSKVVDAAKTALATHESATDPAGCSTHITVLDQWGVAGLSSLEERHPESRVLKGGRIAATYALADLGKLEYSSEVSYLSVGGGGAADDEEEANRHDARVLVAIKESVRAEVDCQVCFALFLDPVNACPAHTYCRTCVRRLLDHSDLCPICRRTFSVRAQATPRTTPSNSRLVSIINAFWADSVATRSQAHRLEEEQAGHGGFDVPVFVCTLSFPSTPLFLHVFEPRYRLMIRRAVAGNRTFGMVLPRPTTPLDSGGEPGFMELGVLLRIVNIEFFPDGRSLLETVGVSRFKITRHGFLDGYVVANVEKVDDISLAEEEALEASEIGQRRDAASQGPVGDDVLSSTAAAQPASATSPAGDWDAMPTKELADFGVEFVRRMQVQSVAWLAARMLAIYGECPEDPATFPWWFACVFPVSDAEKYRLLGTLSVRERLKISCRWIAEWEASRFLLFLLPVAAELAPFFETPDFFLDTDGKFSFALSGFPFARNITHSLLFTTTFLGRISSYV